MIRTDHKPALSMVSVTFVGFLKIGVVRPKQTAAEYNLSKSSSQLSFCLRCRPVRSHTASFERALIFVMIVMKILEHDHSISAFFTIVRPGANERAL